MQDAPKSHIVMPAQSFGFLPRTALFYPDGGDGGGSGAGGAGTDGDGDGAAGNAGGDGAGGDGGNEDEKKKPLVTLERHKAEVAKYKAKLAEYEKADEERKKSEMSEADRLKAEKAELEKNLARFQADEKKQDALAKAKAALAKDGKVIDPEKEDVLNRSLRKLAFDESTLDDDVAELVQMAAVPKGAGHKSVAGKSSPKDEADRDPLSYTGKELGEIHKESPERYQAIMAKRKQAIAAKQAAGK